MSIEPTLTPPVPPIVRILRTLVQLLVAFPLLVPALVELAHAVGIEKVSQAALLVIAAAALAFVVAVQNFLERAGIIPTLGAKPIDTTGSEVSSSTASDIASVLTVYEEHVAPSDRGPWYHRLHALAEKA